MLLTNKIYWSVYICFYFRRFKLSKSLTVQNMPEYGFSLTRILAYFTCCLMLLCLKINKDHKLLQKFLTKKGLN